MIARHVASAINSPNAGQTKRWCSRNAPCPSTLPFVINKPDATAGTLPSAPHKIVQYPTA